MSGISFGLIGTAPALIGANITMPVVGAYSGDGISSDYVIDFGPQI
jgi:hypothetical protein